MDHFLLVDGYNVIHDVEELRAAAEGSLDMARLMLSDALCEYAALCGRRVVLVFDAHLVADGAGSVEDYRGIKLVFTKEAQSADRYIERAAHRLARKGAARRVSVATSDSVEQLIIMASGALRVTPGELWGDMKRAKDEMRARYARTRPVKKNPFEGLLDEETARKLDAMRYGK